MGNWRVIWGGIFFVYSSSYHLQYSTQWDVHFHLLKLSSYRSKVIHSRNAIYFILFPFLDWCICSWDCSTLGCSIVISRPHVKSYSVIIHHVELPSTFILSGIQLLWRYEIKFVFWFPLVVRSQKLWTISNQLTEQMWTGTEGYNDFNIMKWIFCTNTYLPMFHFG